MTATAVILDFDGVVVDTERVYLPIWADVAHKRGKRIAPEVIARTPGKPNRQIVAELFADFSAEVRQAIFDEVNTRARAAIDRELRTIAGVEAFLARCRGKHRLALATNSSRNYVRDLTTRLGMESVFDPIVCGEGKLRPKPEPDIYLQVLESLRLPAERCVVFEDSQVGVQAAKAAGLRVVALAGTFPYEDLAPLTDSVIRDWSEADAHLPG